MELPQIRRDELRTGKASRLRLREEFRVAVDADERSPARNQFCRLVSDRATEIEYPLAVQWRQPVEDFLPGPPERLVFIFLTKLHDSRVS
jgi:hypothetical protein